MRCLKRVHTQKIENNFCFYLFCGVRNFTNGRGSGSYFPLNVSGYNFKTQAHNCCPGNRCSHEGKCFLDDYSGSLSLFNTLSRQQSSDLPTLVCIMAIGHAIALPKSQERQVYANPLKQELIPVSVLWSDLDYCYYLVNGIFVHGRLSFTGQFHQCKNGRIYAHGILHHS